MGKKVLIATWGNPSFWNEVIYNFCGYTCKSKTSLLPLIEVLKPDHVIIFGLDTVADINSLSSLNYNKIKSNAEEKIKIFCQENNIFASLPSNTKLEIFIAPGGGYYPSATFVGKIQDFYHIALHKLIETFTRILDSVSKDLNPQDLENKQDNLEIHLDLTHGINFMPALLYRAIKELIYIIEIFCNVYFFVYNSEPFLLKSPIISPLSIHLVEESKKTSPLLPHDYIEEDGSHIIKLLKPVTDNYDKKSLMFCKSLKPIDINTFISSFYFGLPLAIYTFFIKPDELKQLIDEAKNLFYKEIEVSRNDVNNTLIVKRKLSFTEEYSVINRVYLLSQLSSYYLGLDKKEVITFDEFKSLADTLFKKFLNIRTIILNEVHYFERYFNNKLKSDWKSVMELCESDLNGKKSEPNPRNFIAHAGLEKTLTKIKKAEKDIILKYDEEKIETIKNIASKAIKLRD